MVIFGNVVNSVYKSVNIDYNKGVLLIEIKGVSYMRNWIIKDITNTLNVSQFAEVAEISRPYVYTLIKNGKIHQNNDGDLFAFEAFQIKLMNNNKRLLTYYDMLNLGFISKTLNQQNVSLRFIMDSLYDIFQIYNDSKSSSLFEVKRYMMKFFELILCNILTEINDVNWESIISDKERIFYKQKCNKIYIDFLKLARTNRYHFFVSDESLLLIKRVLDNDFKVSYEDLHDSLKIVFYFYTCDVCDELNKESELDFYSFSLIDVILYFVEQRLNNDTLLSNMSIDQTLDLFIIKGTLLSHLIGFK